MANVHLKPYSFSPLESSSEVLSQSSFIGSALAARLNYVYELLEERPSNWEIDVRAMIPQLKGLEGTNFRHLCGTIVESGKSSILKQLLQEFGHCIGAETFHLMFFVAGLRKETAIYRLLEGTPDIELAVKYAAIGKDRECKNSVYNQLKLNPAVPTTVLEDLGASETIIRKESFDAGIRASVEAPSQRFTRVIYPKTIHPSLKKSDSDEQKCLLRIDALLQQDVGRSSGETRELANLYRVMIEKECTRQRERMIHDANLVAVPKKAANDFEGAEGESDNSSAIVMTRPSCAQVLEAFYFCLFREPQQHPVTINSFIQHLLDTWSEPDKKFSRENLSKLMIDCHPQGKTLTNTIMYQWKNHPDVCNPNRESIQIICDSLALEFKHELMLWKIARGAVVEGNLTELLYNVSHAVTPHERKSFRSRLVRSLHESSGIPHARLQELLGVQQLIPWRKGARVEDLTMAMRLAELTNPPDLAADSEQYTIRVEQNRQIGLLLGARPLSVIDAWQRSQSAKNRSGKFLSLLTGREGLVPISSHSFAQMMGISSSKVHHMRDSGTSRGGKIDQTQAIEISRIVQGLSQSTDALLTYQEQVDREQIIEGLTGHKNPLGLFCAYLRGEIFPLGEVVRRTRLRRGQMQLPGTSSFELGKETIGYERAAMLADYLGFSAAFYQNPRRLFIREAMGLERNLSADDVLDGVIEGKISRTKGLSRLLEISLLTQPMLSKEIRIPTSTVRTWFTAERRGYIAGGGNRAKLCAAVGLLARLNDFHRVYGVPSFVALTEDGGKSAGLSRDSQQV